jgi:pimeloyl-ACP methyl ester carboxylesterase
MNLPMRCACTESQIDELFDSVESVLRSGTWVLAGHSRGAMLSARYVHERTALPAALALLGTTHPRDFSLADLTIPVAKIYGTRDGVAPISASNKELLPRNTRWVAIQGGNHVQFGYYRHQLFDDDAAITRDEQQRLTAAALLKMLE